MARFNLLFMWVFVGKYGLWAVYMAEIAMYVTQAVVYLYDVDCLKKSGKLGGHICHS